jgi:glutamate N-acetyltransferase / amino-acid N-acetyltransferase
MNIAVPQGWRFAGVKAGIKPSGGADLAALVSDRVAAAAGVYTTNRLQAAPVQLCRQRTPRGLRAVLVNAGNANACTGDQGLRDAEAAAGLLAAALGCPAEQVAMCSTGVIGRPLPMAVFPAGTKAVAAALAHSPAAVEAAARAIMTTDTRPKIVSRTVATPHGPRVVLGICKGAAMIGPNLATMLAFVVTDARLAAAELDAMLRQAMDRSFHCVGVEGHTSTNDTVLLLANGAAGPEPDDAAVFAPVVTEVCAALAMEIAKDAEGAAHFVTIDVTGTRTDDDARRIAKEVADSPLVKTAIFGADPNWGRICSAAGYAGVPFAETDLSLKLNGMPLYVRGVPLPFDAAAASRHLKDHRDVRIELTLTLGAGHCRFWTCDLTYDYVRLNADYTT